MLRIIGNDILEGKRTGAFRVRAVEVGGHLELSATREVVWSELEFPFDPSVCWDRKADLIAAMAQEREDTAAQRREACSRIAANRAKKRVRLLCKSIAADTLLTLTYRGLQTDLALCKVHLKEFSRRLMRVWPQFQAVAAFEQQQRGAWHVHIATTAIPKELTHASGVKVKSYNLIRSIWRSVTKQLEGNIDVARKKRNSKRSPAKIAAYLAKYMAKDFAEGEKWVNRYTTFGKPEMPKSIDLGLINCPNEMIQVCYQLCSSYNISNAHYSHWGDWFFIHAERPK
jgi:hypothetical protein